VCHDEASRLYGCIHELCRECYDHIVMTFPIRGRDDLEVWRSFDAIYCPECRDPKSSSSDVLEMVKEFLVGYKVRLAISEQERIVNQARAVAFVQRRSRRRETVVEVLQPEEIEQRRQSDIDAIVQVNEQSRQNIRNGVFERERIRSMLGRGEALPPNTDLGFRPEDVDMIHFCSNGCRIPRERIVRRYDITGFEADVVVSGSTRCVDCGNHIVSSWDNEARISYRAVETLSAEEHQRIDELYDTLFYNQVEAEQDAYEWNEDDHNEQLYDEDEGELEHIRRSRRLRNFNF